MPFYTNVLSQLDLPRDAHILVVCGDELDRDSLRSCGFINVVISNLDERVQGHEFQPYAWAFEDAEALRYQDNSFDYVIVHAGLHHCSSPHRALLEMFRVARSGVLAFEARDSFMMKVAIKVGRVPAYESCAVRAHGFQYGGVRNTAVPNYIYRWTESEVTKTIESYAPERPPTIRYFYGLQVPHERVPSPRVLIELCLSAIARLIPTQCNQFAFFIEKCSTDLYPWLKSPTEFNRDYVGI